MQARWAHGAIHRVGCTSASQSLASVPWAARGKSTAASLMEFSSCIIGIPMAHGMWLHRRASAGSCDGVRRRACASFRKSQLKSESKVQMLYLRLCKTVGTHTCGTERLTIAFNSRPQQASRRSARLRFQEVAVMIVHPRQYEVQLYHRG
jgi:hypothetical protein